VKARFFSAVVALAVLIPCLVLWEAQAAEWIVALVMGIGLYEYARMALPGDKFAALPLLVSGGLIYTTALHCAADGLRTAVVLGVLLIFLWSLFKVEAVEEAFSRVSKLSFGLLWVVIGGVHITLLAKTDMRWVVLLLLIVFAADTGAYFTGRAIGKHKLFERVSPKKTWEGVFGGLVTAVAATLLFAHYELPDLAINHGILLAILVGAAGVCGDLVESLVKRACGVKDSGSIMPGHGGALDRVDSLLLGGPVMVVVLEQLGLFSAA
jgi:phosphatidate cytidylyltransferase